MGQVAITLNDRTYRLVCDDGEEDRLVDLAQIVKGKIDALRADVGHVGDERLMLMAALLIADELVEARANLAHQQQGSADAFAMHARSRGLGTGHRPASKYDRQAAAKRRCIKTQNYNAQNVKSFRSC
jgi:cell division protein ZapA